MYTRSSFASLLLVTLGLFFGCSSNSTDATTVTGTPRPGIGSTFTFREISAAEDGSTVADSLTTYRLLDTSANYAGRAGVVIAANSAADTVAYAYTSTGLTIYRPRIPIFETVALPERWVSIDTTKTATLNLYDQIDTVSYSGTKLYFTSHAEMQPLADTTIVVASKTYSAIRWRTRSTVLVKVAITGQTSTTVVEETRAFSPQLGFFIADETVTNSDSQQSPIPNGTVTASLESFVKK